MFKRVTDSCAASDLLKVESHILDRWSSHAPYTYRIAFPVGTNSYPLWCEHSLLVIVLGKLTSRQQLGLEAL